MVEQHAESHHSQDDPHDYSDAGYLLMPSHLGFEGFQLLLLLMQTRVVGVH